MPREEPIDARAPCAPSIRVLVVDDQPLFLAVARDLLAMTPGFEEIGQARSGEQGVALAASLRPDLVLMDVRMPGIGGLEAARLITAAGSAAVVLVSSDPEAVPAAAAAECGALAVLAKERLRPKMLNTFRERIAAHAAGA
jgi:two-component system, NarL family, invasion response regulator UvrY